MLYTFKAKIQAGGVVMPYYFSERSISVNANEPDVAREEAEIRVRRAVARDMALGIGMVKVTDLQLTGVS